jgi:hypothetical protein
MSTTIETKIEEALALLIATDLPFMVMIQTPQGSANYFSNSKGDRLFTVGQEDQ